MKYKFLDWNYIAESIINGINSILDMFHLPDNFLIRLLIICVFFAGVGIILGLLGLVF